MSETSTLTSLVLLRNQTDKGNDYFDYLTPFVEQIYVKQPNCILTGNQVQRQILKIFGLNIPVLVVTRVLNRMRKKGFLTRKKDKYFQSCEFETTNLDPSILKAAKQIETVQMALVDFSKRLGRTDFTPSEAILAIQQFLNRFQIECIQSYAEGTALPTQLKMEDWREALVGLFFKSIRKKKGNLYKSFMIFVEGNMLANALRSTDEETPPSSFKITTFYFDTPDILSALGYLGEDSEVQVREVMRMLKKLGGEISVFTHNVDEAKGIMNAAANDLTNPEFAQRPFNRVARMNNWTRSDIIIMKEKIEENIKELGFTIRTTPSQIQRFQIDEQTLRDIVQDTVGYRKSTEMALENDIRSIYAIYTLRQGDQSVSSNPRRIEECNSMLVTSNYALARASSKFTNHDDGEEGYTSTIGMFSIANIAWLKAPNVGSHFVDAQAIAQAYSTLKLPEKEFLGIHKAAEKLREEGVIAKEDLAHLRTSSTITDDIAVLRIADNTVGNEETAKAIVELFRSKVEEKAKTEGLRARRLLRELNKLKKERAQEEIARNSNKFPFQYQAIFMYLLRILSNGKMFLGTILVLISAIYVAVVHTDIFIWSVNFLSFGNEIFIATIVLLLLAVAIGCFKYGSHLYYKLKLYIKGVVNKW